MFNPVHTRGALLAVAAVLLAAAVPNAAAQSPWGNRDVGRPAEGSIEIVDESTVLVAAAGSGIGGKADRFHFSYKHFYGDVDLTVRIDSVTRADADMQSGVMFRGALGSQAKSVALLYSPVSGVVLQFERGVGVAGTFVAPAGASAADLARVRLSLKAVDTLASFAPQPPVASVQPDGKFQFDGIGADTGV